MGKEISVKLLESVSDALIYEMGISTIDNNF
jgi:hypothetical protein